ncbi:MAG: FAD-dependent oxidoreductase [Gammaproteobacteria bacterium]|nr:FAD-dependent oxidoreductase [Gammaproteobacteria bacterium]MCP5198633.1 FAD-dependent oxidoreductase [Gammaproteobacteria bacterium]
MAAAPYVVIGGGQAGLQICDSLRRLGYDGPLVLLAAESSPPYQRPPLSKKFLAGDLEAERLYFRPSSWFEKNAVELRLECTVTAIDRAARRVSCADGSVVDYARLALATGARIRPLACPGADLADICYVRSLADSEALRARLPGAARLAVVGGGFIGLEVAAIARTLGKSVVLYEGLDRLMARAVSPTISDYYAALHRGHGVDLRLGCGIAAIERTRHGLLVRDANGGEVEVDIVVAGIGVVPNDEIAAAAGLECRGGIVVDAQARTSDADIVAAGDCTWHYNGFLAREIRLESVQNAVDQAKVAAASLLGAGEPYVQVPWFWSDQYDVKLQMAGIGMPHDNSALRGTTASGSFSLFYFRDGRLVGADSVNRPADHMACRRLLAQGTMVTAAQVADSEVDLMQIARG